MKKTNALISHTSYDTLDIRGKVVGKRTARNFYHVEDLLKSCDIGLSTVIIDKKIYGRDCNFSNFKTKEDFIFWLNILKKGYFYTWTKSKFSIMERKLKTLYPLLLFRS